MNACVTMKLQDLFNKVHNHYIMGYISDGEFWCVHETASLEKAQEMLQQHRQIFSHKKQEYLIIKKIISYEQLKD